MAITANFTATQQIGLPNSIFLTDTHTGTDVTVTEKRVYVQDVYGNYLVPSGTTTNYVVWALADSTISIACLLTDTAPYVRTDWVDASGVVKATKTILCDFNLFNLQESFRLTSSLTSNPSLLQDNNWWNNKMKLRVNIDDSVEAVSIGGNQEIAQNALDRATYLTQNASIFF